MARPLGAESFDEIDPLVCSTVVYKPTATESTLRSTLSYAALQTLQTSLFLALAIILALHGIALVIRGWSCALAHRSVRYSAGPRLGLMEFHGASQNFFDSSGFFVIWKLCMFVLLLRWHYRTSWPYRPIFQIDRPLSKAVASQTILSSVLSQYCDGCGLLLEMFQDLPSALPVS